jgi:1-deoxy-D-xylulose-5-phosphate reductoisomerase
MSNKSPKKRIAIFGSTGSIGRQALEVIDANPAIFSTEVLTAQTNDDLLIRQALHFNPNIVVIGDEKKYGRVKEALAARPIKVFAAKRRWMRWLAWMFTI